MADIDIINLLLGAGASAGVGVISGLPKKVSKLIDTAISGFENRAKINTMRAESEEKAESIKRIAEAKAEAKIIEASTKVQVAKIGKDAENQMQYRTVEVTPELLERVNRRIDSKELRRQLNGEKIIEKAGQLLQNSANDVSDEPVNEDWSTRFFNIAQDISDNEMQNLWAKILAGEIERPQTYSLRTLELLKNISKHEADIINRAANLAISAEKRYFIFDPIGDRKLDTFGITIYELLVLEELGVVINTNNLKFVTYTDSAKYQTYRYGKKGLYVTWQPGTSDIKIPALSFTQVGNELLKLIEPIPNKAYLKAIQSFLQKKNAKMQIGDYIIGSQGDRIINVIDIG